MRVVLIDDVLSNLIFMRQLVRQLGENTILDFTNPLKALAVLRRHSADLILVDYRMPGMDGITFIREVRAISGLEDIPILMVTTSEDREVLLAALDAGATDFLRRPTDAAEMLARIRNMLKLQESHTKLRDRAAWLETEVQKASASITSREEETIVRLARAAEYRDPTSSQHLERMSRYFRLVAEALGIDQPSCRDLALAALMHDIGKIAVSDRILLKPGKLTSDERAKVEQHTIFGHDILAGSDSELIRIAAQIALYHHERWDGKGYPQRRRGIEIPLPARIAAVADVFDALTSERPYKQAWSPAEAHSYILENSGSQFDPACVTSFLARWPEVLGVYRSSGDAGHPPVEAMQMGTCSRPLAARG